MKRILAVLFLIIAACSTSKSPTEPVDSDTFAIYLTKDSLTISQALERGIENIQLAEQPLLTINDIQHYDFDNHYIVLKENRKPDFFDLSMKSEAQFYNKAFVVVAFDEPVYIGGFYAYVMSYFPSCPTITIGIGTDNDIAKNAFRIQKQSFDNGPDERNDERIRKALLVSGLFE